MARPRLKVEVAFDVGANGGDWFTIGDPTKGVIGSADHTIAPSTVWVDVSSPRPPEEATWPSVWPSTWPGSSYVYAGTRGSAKFIRGRDRALDEPRAGTGQATLDNRDGRFDPLNTAGPYYSQLTPMRRIRVQADVAGSLVDVWSGYVEDLQPDFAGFDSTAEVTAIDAIGALSGAELDETAPQDAGDLSGQRVTKVLDRSEVAFPYTRDIDDGVSVLGATTYGDNATTYLQKVAKSENGRLYVSADGKLTFRDRHSSFSTEPSVTFTNDGTGVEYQDAEPDSPLEMLFNRVVASGVSGVEQVAEDAESRGEYLVRTLDRTGLLVQDDAEAQSIARYMLGRYSQPTRRLASIGVALDGLTATEQLNVLRLDVSHRVRVVWSPPGAGWEITLDHVIEGVTDDVSGSGWIRTLRLSAADTNNYLRIGDAQYGLIGSNLIGY